jgi:glycosyltransferase involved in cell wall biosynthesis
MLPHQVAEELQTPTMLLMPTRADTSPNAVKEAVVAGVPVVASHVGGIPDYVFPGMNGVLFPPNDLGAFVGAIRSACVHPMLGKGQVDPETHARTRDYLSPERMAENFLKAYELAMNNP